MVLHMTRCHLFFDMLLFFWLVVMCLLSSLDRIDVGVEVPADDVWEADNKPGLSVGVDRYDQLFLYKRPMSFPIVGHGNKTEIW